MNDLPALVALAEVGGAQPADVTHGQIVGPAAGWSPAPDR